jgi:PAS domain S-box-containing protein
MPTITSSSEPAVSIKHGVPLLLFLILAGLAGNYFKFPIFLNIDFLFGSIFAMLALQFFGLGRGILAAAITASYTYVLWNHPYAIVIMTAEVAVVAWLMNRHKLGLVLADAIYWIVIGIPLVYLFYHIVMNVPVNSVSMTMSKQVVNGIANAIVARLVFAVYILRTRSSLLSYKEIISTLLTFFVMFPALIMLAVDGRADFKKVDSQIRTTLVRDSTRLTLRLETWVLNRKTAIINLAEMASNKTPQHMQSYLEQANKSDINLLRVGLLDSEATITAYSPLQDEIGQNNIGKNFADRPYIPILKQELKPMLSEVVMGRIGNPKPFVSILAPVMIRGAYGGYVIGVLGLQQIQEHLDKSAEDSSMLYTLLDKNSNVIMTNRADQKIMTPFVRSDGSSYSLNDKRVSQWIPVLPHNTPASERWRKSSYLSESKIGNLAEWKLIVEQPVAPHQTILYKNFTEKLILLSMIFIGALLLAEFLGNKIVSTLLLLRNLTYELPPKLASGSQKIIWPESGIIETSHLINNFKEMAVTLSGQFLEVQQINESLEARVEERTENLASITQELNILLENAPVGICKIVDRKLVWFNRATQTLFQYSRDEIEHQTTRQFYPSEEAYKKLGEEAYPVLAQGLVYKSVQNLLRKDGTRILVGYTGKALDPPDMTKGTLWLMEDITEQKRAEEKLSKSEALYHSLVETSQDLIWQCDAEGRYTYLNLAWEQVFGYELNEMLGQTFYDFQTPEAAARDQLEFSRLMKGNSVHGYETKHIGKSGNEIHLVFNALFMTDEHGNIVGASGTAYDITQRKLMEIDLLKAKATAESASIAKGQFLANMSHEIRTPMNGVIGLLEMLQATQLDEEQHNYAKLALMSGRSLVQLINDILDLSKIEAHKIQIENRDFNLEMETVGAINILSLHAQEKGLELSFQIDDDVPLSLCGDSGRLRQILNNMIGNAIKFTSCGSVTLLIRKDHEDDVNVALRFLIRDTGIGVGSDKLDIIFEPFTQADSSTTRKFGGTGLGLTISRQLAELMGGAVGVDSHEGDGSTFWFTVILEKSRLPISFLHDENVEFPGATIPKSCSDYSNIRLLLAEDDPINQMVTKSILSKFGYQVDVANNGREVLALLAANDYSLVLLDCMMPEMNGYETIAVIRNNSSNVRNHIIPVIALTANAMQEDRDACLAAGMDDYLSKPLEIEKLMKMLDKWISDGHGREAAAHGSEVTGKDAADVAVIFDLDKFVRRNLGDLELSSDVAVIFSDSAPEYLESIRIALAANDAADLRQSSHKLKGAAANLELPLLSETAGIIELCARDSELSKARDLLPGLENRLMQSLESLKSRLIATSE